MPIGMAAATLGAAAIGGAFSLGGSVASAKLASKEAARNRDFQERMSNTAYQRAADDMELAGLNRILALGSPASTPSGSVPTIPDFGQSMSAGANMGINAASSAQTMSQQKAATDQILEQTKGISTQNKIKLQQSELWETMAPILVQGGKDFNALLNIAKAEAPAVLEAVRNSGSEIVDYFDQVLYNLFGKKSEVLTNWMESALLEPIQINKGEN